MNKRFLGIIIVLAGIVILVVVVKVVFLGNFSISDLFNKNKDLEVATSTETAVTSTEIKPRVSEAVIRERPASQNPQAQPIDPIKRSEVSEFNKEDLSRMAASFTERFGSYSNHSNFSNIVDLKVFMSEKMGKWGDTFVYEQRKNNLSEALYFGITTKAVGHEVKTFDDDIGNASILITTRRREYTGSTNNLSNTYDQDILIGFTNELGAWKVNSADWLDRY